MIQVRKMKGDAMFGACGWHKGIRFRFLALTAGVLFVSTAVLITIIAINEKNTLKRSLLARGRGLATYIAKLSPDPLVMHDTVQLDSIVGEANKDPDTLYAFIKDAGDTIVTTQFSSINYRSPRVKSIIGGLPKTSELPDVVVAIKKKEALTEITVPVVTGTDRVGAVTLALSEQNIREQLWKTTLFVLALNMTVMFVLGGVLFVVSKRTILDPVIDLGQAAALLAKGELSTRVEVQAAGEIGMLVESFNRMAEDLQRTTVSKVYVDNIIQSMINTLLVVSTEGRILSANAATCRLLEYEEHELVGQPVTKVFATLPSWEGTARETPGKQKRGDSIEVTYLAKGGEKIPMLYSSSVLYGSKGEFQGVVCVAQDLADRKRAEEALAEKAEKLAASNAELEQFGYVASHDLQEPLRKIRAFGDRLCDKFGDVLNEQGRDYLMRMQNAAERMQTLINDLLAFSRVTTKAQPFAPVDLRQVALGVLSDLETQVERTRGRVEVAALPTIYADGLQMRQLLQNLIGNALKFSRSVETPTVNVFCSLVEDRRGRQVSPLCQIRVADNGIGFDEKYLDRIFAPFQRLHGRSEYEGSGIGLAICKKIAQRHGGTITAESRPGEGATFIVTLPVDTIAAQGGLHGDA